MGSKLRLAAPAILGETIILALACALLSARSAGQGVADTVFDVPLVDVSAGGSPLEVHGKALLHEAVAGPELEWAWGANVSAKNVSDKPITLVLATLRELGRHPESGHRGGLGDGPTYIIVEDRFFSDTDIRPMESVILRDTAPGKLGEGCCLNSMDKVRTPRVELNVIFVQFADGSTYGDRSAASDVFVRRRAAMSALAELVRSQEADEKSFGEKIEGMCASLGSTCPQVAQAFEKNGKRGALAEAQRLMAIAGRHANLVGHSSGVGEMRQLSHSETRSRRPQAAG